MSGLIKKLKLLKLGDVAVRRNPWFYADARQCLERMDRADASEIGHWTAARLAEVLWAARRSRYGRAVRGGNTLESWPLLDKAQVQGAPQTFCTQSQLLTIKASTGGTTGAPLKLFRSLRAIVFEQACLDFMMQKLGADARLARCAVLRTDAIKDPNDFRPPYWVHANGGARLVFSSSHLNAATVSSYAQALQEFRPEVLLGYPTSLEALCTLLRQADIRLSVPRVMCSSEMLRPQVWEEAQRQLSCKMLDYYGQAERVAFAYAMAPGEYRFLPAYAHVEFHPIAVEDGQRVCEIVGTPLWNLSMPLVRYRTGDLIRLPLEWTERELREVALGLRPFSGVQGRSGDILLSPDGVRITGISHFQRDLANVRRIQVIQETSADVTILVLAEEAYSERDAQALMANVRLKLPASMRVTIRRSESLERTALGKTPFVIHRLPVKSALIGAVAREGRA